MSDNKKIESDIKEKLVAINRITKVVKGGRRFGFAALVVVGNQKGSIGIGQGKSKQVPDAIKKATEVAKRNQVKIPLKDGRTLHHDVKGKNGSGKVSPSPLVHPQTSGLPSLNSCPKSQQQKHGCSNVGYPRSSKVNSGSLNLSRPSTRVWCALRSPGRHLSHPADEMQSSTQLS